MSRLAGSPRATTRFSILTASLAVALFAATTAQAKPQDEKVVLRIKAVEGATTKYKSESKVKLSISGQDLDIDSTERLKVTATKIHEDGSISFDRITESSTMTMNGEEMDMGDEEEDPGSTYRLKPNGLTIEQKSKSKESDEATEELMARIGQASSVIFSDMAVGPGDKWTFEFTANKETKAPGGKSEYTFVAFEDFAGTRVAKIEFTYKESGTTKIIDGSGTAWIEIASGDTVKSSTKFSNAPFDMGGQEIVASGSTAIERTSGSFLAASTEGTPAQTEGSDEETKEDEDNIDKKVKDFEKIDGLMPIYRKVDDGRTKLFMEVPTSKLGKLMFLQATASTGNSSEAIAGNPIKDIVFRFEEMPNNKLYMVVPNYRFRADSTKPIGKAVQRSFSDSYIESFDIEARQKDRSSVLIDISELFIGNIAGVQEMFMGGGGGLLGLGGSTYSPDREKSFIKTLKNFPTNTYVQTTYVFQGRGGGEMEELMGTALSGDTRAVTVVVNYNLCELEDNGYLPRRFDSRIGYFTTDYQEFTDDIATDQKVMNILRWNLKKKDPNADLSEPVKPIEFWLDDAIPTEYRETVKSALLEWNKAFEKVGFKNAVVVHQITEDSDIDHADMRYNVIRWVTSPGDAYAIALFRVNPITGEIINASVTVDANIVRVFATEHDDLINPANQFKRETPEERVAKLAKNHSCIDCDAVQMGKGNLKFGAKALEMTGAGISKTQYVKQFIKWVVMHEFGHVLGLRHNFVSSTQLSLEQMKNGPEVARLGTSASVMDYIAFNISALNRSNVDYFGQTIGSYDYWAIKYGYTLIPEARTSEGEIYKLSQIAKVGKQEGYEWQGDETADSIDPYVTRFDLTAEPLDYWTQLMQTSRHLMFNLDKHSPKPGESYWEFTKDFNMLLNEYAKGASQASRYIGGIRRSNSYAGDANGRQPIQSIPAAQQRRALGLLTKYVFAENAFSFPKHYYTMFQANPKGNLMDSMLGAGDDFPMYSQFAGLQSSALFSVLNSGTLNRLLNAEFKSAKAGDALTPREAMREIRAAVWSELAAGKAITPLRRQLQREHVDQLISLGVKGGTGEITTLAWTELRSVRNSIKSAKSKDAATNEHLAELAMRIDRALNAVETLGGSSAPSGMGSLLDLLGGAKKKD